MIARIALLALAGTALSVASTRAPLRTPDLPAQNLPIYGGSGGSSFTRSCGADMVLTGLRYRYGLVIDAVGLLCRPVNADGSLGAQTTIGSLAGGGGGTAKTASCPSGEVAFGARIHYGTYVDGIVLQCRTWNAATRSFVEPGHVSPYMGMDRKTSALVQCENATQPMVAIRGRAAMLVDALGFTCNEP